ncbi:MAG: ATP synthase F1 subunit epsilon [Candidatus Berkelbacteria bacterium]
MNTFKLKLISPSGIAYEAEATEITLPTTDGEIGILPNHEPLITLIKAGLIKIKNGREEKELATEGGIAEINNNVIKILADTAEDTANLDELKIMKAKELAEKHLTEAKNEIEFADASANLEKQLTMLSLATKRKKKYR